jgi:broad specificity phosphatase PhoE
MGAIYLVRHGQASFGAHDYDRLSATGARQSEAVGMELRRREARLAHARSGTLARQRDTAVAALAECAPELTVAEDARWNEYDHIDIAEHHGGGAAQDSADPRAFQAALDRALAEWVRAGESSPCAETWPQFLVRVCGGLDELVSDLNRGEDAVVFTSGGVIAALGGRLLGDPVLGLLRLNRVTVNASVTKLIYGRGGVTMLSFNEHGHFDGAAGELLTYR